MSVSDRPPSLDIVPGRQRVPTHLARRLHQICVAMISETVTPDDLTPPQWSVLAQLDSTPGVDGTALARACGIDPTSTAQFLANLERRGLARREPSPQDRRAWSFYPTEAGQALFRKLSPATLEVNALLLSPLTPKQADAFVAALIRIVEAHEAHARPGAGRRPPRPRPTGDTA